MFCVSTISKNLPRKVYHKGLGNQWLALMSLVDEVPLQKKKVLGKGK